MNRSNINYYKEIDWLPRIPDTLIEDFESFSKRGNIFRSETVEGIYESYLVLPELRNFLQEYFDRPINARYQVINSQLPVHIDIGSFSRKFNYILDPGGEDVFTRWWNSVDNPENIIYSTIAPSRKWHEIRVDVPHDISAVLYPRISIEVHEPSEEDLDEV